MSQKPVTTTVSAPTSSVFQRTSQAAFNTLYNRSLLYNTCWEDPALDREAMEIGRDDSIMVITSAGCNALDYALDAPKAIHCIDANPMQNALIELKIAGIRTLEWDDFFRLFGIGVHNHFEELYRTKLRRELSIQARAFWDERRSWFNGRGWRSSFYFYGLAGLVARLMKMFINRSSRCRRGINDLLAATNLEEQRDIYDNAVAPHIWTPSLKWALSRPIAMSLLGVPYPQREEVKASHSDGVAGFVRSCLDYVCRCLPISDNYFWAVYLRGHYTQQCCPSYLKPAQFAALKADLVDVITPHTTTVTHFLQNHDDQISRFVLLDHMDWMGWYYPEALAEEWGAIMNSASDSARVLFRSGAAQPEFLKPLTVHRKGSDSPLMEHLHFHQEWADRLHQRDRVHTYASFHIADIKG